MVGDHDEQTLYDQIRETGQNAVTKGKQYSGLLIPSGVELSAKITEYDVFGSYIDPWNGDKIVHGWFSKDLSKAAWNSSDKIGKYLEQSNNDTISSSGQALQDPYTKTALAVGAVSAFSGLKEFWYDGNPDGIDIAANYTGMSYHLLQEHHDIDPLQPAKDAYNNLKEGITETYQH